MSAIAAQTNSPQVVNNMSPDIILNPTVSPTMMCHEQTDHNNLLNSQVSLNNAMLNAINLPHTTQETILNNIIQPVMTQHTEALHIPHKTPPVSVKNMFLNAAAEILTSQTSPMNAETTINALMSLNSNPILSEQEQQHVVQSMLTNSQAPSLPVTNDVQQQVDCQRINDALCHTQAQLEQHMPMFNDQTNNVQCGMLQTSDLLQNENNLLNNVAINIVHREMLNQEIRFAEMHRNQELHLQCIQQERMLQQQHHDYHYKNNQLSADNLR